MALWAEQLVSGFHRPTSSPELDLALLHAAIH